MRFDDIPKAEKLAILIHKLDTLFQYDGTCVILESEGEVVDAWGEAHDALKAFKKFRNDDQPTQPKKG